MKPKPVLSFRFSPRAAGSAVFTRNIELPLPHKRYFYVWALMAIARVDAVTEEEVFITVERIRRLPGWSRAGESSIGKKIGTYIRTIPKDLVDTPHPNAGPYRLVPNRSQIRVVGGSIDDLRELLAGARTQAFIPPDKQQQFYTWAEEIWQGDFHVDTGAFAEAMIHYRRALTAAHLPEQKIVTLHAMGRVHLKRNEYPKVDSIHQQLRLEIKRAGSFASWGMARMYEQEGLREYNKAANLLRDLKPEEVARIRRSLNKALNLLEGTGHFGPLSDIHGLLGKVAGDQLELHAAIDELNLALLYSVTAGSYEFTIHEAYYGLANLYDALAFREKGAGRVKETIQYFDAAIAWLKKAIRLRILLPVARADARPEWLSARIRMQLTVLDKPRAERHLRTAETLILKAQELADTAGDEEMREKVCDVLASVRLAQYRDEEAYSVVEKCKKELKKKVLSNLGPEVREFFKDESRRRKKIQDTIK